MSNRRKILAVALTAALLTSTTAISVSAIDDVSEIKEHSVGIVGSFNEWGADGDVAMTDDDGDGIYEGTVTIDEATEDMVVVATMDDGTGSQVERGMTGITFKVRLDGEWLDSWGEYEPAYVRTGNSQTNCCVECAVGDKVVINVKLDTTRNAQQAIDDGEVGADEPVYFDLIPVTYTATVESKTDYEHKTDSGSCGENLTYALDSEGTLTISGTGDMEDYDWAVSPFYHNEDIKKVIIEDGVTRIGCCAFVECLSLESVTIPDSVTSIGSQAFQNCTSLTSVTIPDSVTSIGYYAFEDCTFLTDITIPESVKDIGDYAFGYYEDTENYNYVKLPGFTIKGYNGSGAERYANYNEFEFISLGDPDITESGKCGENLTYNLDSDGTLTISGTGEMYNYVYGESPFNTEIETVIIEDGVTTIGDCAFGGCEVLTDITIPDSVTSIGESAFADCTSLTDITIPDSVTSIGDDAFCDCEVLTDITIPDSVTSIEDWAFYGCTSLTDITIPDSVTSIGEGAFQGCTSLTDITIPDSVTSIEDWAFYGCTSLTDITIPDSVTSIGEGALGYNRDPDSGEDVKQPGFTIYGYTGSEAERYANDNGFEFISLGEVPVPVLKTGDITGDGSVDIADSLFVARADAGLATLTDAQKQAADVNKDGSADIADALMIARFDAQLITKLG